MIHKLYLKIFMIPLFLILDSSITFSAERPHEASYYVKTATIMLKAKNYAQSKKILEQGLKLYPSYSQLNQMMGRYYYETSQYDKARYFLYHATKDDNDNWDAKLLLVNVEERQHNYSSAICYINELLENSPYKKDLWLKKIGLYRKMKNDIQADHLLTRLVQIYPQDKNLRARLKGRMEEKAKHARSKTENDYAITMLQQIISNGPTDNETYLELSNLLLQAGRDNDALATITQGLQHFPGNVTLARKKASILAGQHRWGEAIDFIKDFSRHHSSLDDMLKSIQESAAQDAIRNDPYEMNKNIYARTKSQEAFNYVLKTAIARNYTTDALYYLEIALKAHGDNPALLLKEFDIYKRIGDKKKATTTLEKLLKIQPNNVEAADELSSYRIDEATSLMTTFDYIEAIPLLRFAKDHAVDREIKISAINKLYTCLFETKQYSAATSILDTLHKIAPNTISVYLRQADLLTTQGKTEEALKLLKERIDKETNNSNRSILISDYETISLAYIKSLINNGATIQAMAWTKTLLQLSPTSKGGLTDAIACSDILKNYNDYDMYTRLTMKYYPNDVFFHIKQAAGYAHHERFEQALNTLRPLMNAYPGDTLLRKAFVDHSGYLALKYIDHHEGERAINVLDSALIYMPNNRTILYTKGIAYESMHEYDSAYVYQKYYRPSLTEVTDYNTHMEMLQNKSYTNRVTLSYHQTRRGEEDYLTSIASIGYSYLKKDNTYTATLNYAGRDTGNDSDGGSYGPGGIGIQGQVEWEHTFNQKMTGMANIAYASRYFPMLMANIKLERLLKNDWSAEIHAGFRQVETNTRTFKWVINEETNEGNWAFDKWNTGHKSMLNLGAGITKMWDEFGLNAKADAMLYGSAICYNISILSKYEPFDSRLLDLRASAGLGNSPETSLIDAALPGMYKKINTMVSAGATYFLMRSITLAIDGTWNTFSNALNYRTGTQANPLDDIQYKYKTFFTLNATLILSF